MWINIVVVWRAAEELLGREVLKRFGWFYRLSFLKPSKWGPNTVDLKTSDKAWLRRCTHFVQRLSQACWSCSNQHLLNRMKKKTAPHWDTDGGKSGIFCKGGPACHDCKRENNDVLWLKHYQRCRNSKSESGRKLVCIATTFLTERVNRVKGNRVLTHWVGFSEWAENPYHHTSSTHSQSNWVIHSFCEWGWDTEWFVRSLLRLIAGRVHDSRVESINQSCCFCRWANSAFSFLMYLYKCSWKC